MSIIYVLIPLAIIIVAIAIAIFFWAVKSNQFDDLERQGYSILFDDDIQPNNTNSAKSSTNKSVENDDADLDKASSTGEANSKSKTPINKSKS
ncbi:cytochrome oxidase maturation protein, cbb3-type [Glaciecola punicea ACAM 611]|uniref:Cytochrome oxidase maturation protein, cbb3-type n=1 Tax=Glaciecola punicea ACAM 611 TaxID=1121923 RepID=H5T9L5_9ALTE|nr:cbb3-type cytochrome oxidase assembly protein CcoS [Glaciecola punicea]GAB54992.1 cytochrome oxidase maturation protein, cbb3-type [Glaciecola punicea ACAM 611]